jgi:hypothetical protein
LELENACRAEDQPAKVPEHVISINAEGGRTFQEVTLFLSILILGSSVIMNVLLVLVVCIGELAFYHITPLFDNPFRAGLNDFDVERVQQVMKLSIFTD